MVHAHVKNSTDEKRRKIGEAHARAQLLAADDPRSQAKWSRVLSVTLSHKLADIYPRNVQFHGRKV